MQPDAEPMFEIKIVVVNPAAVQDLFALDQGNDHLQTVAGSLFQKACQGQDYFLKELGFRLSAFPPIQP